EIQVSESEMQQAVMAQARQYPGQEREFLEFVSKNDGARQQISAPIFEDKVVDYLIELADVTEKSVTKDELQKAVEALDAGEAV
ncbi:MAG: trigger factor, partial [Pseudomonadota bacterium]